MYVKPPECKDAAESRRFDGIRCYLEALQIFAAANAAKKGS